MPLLPLLGFATVYPSIMHDLNSLCLYTLCASVYAIAVPGQVEGLLCPSSPDDGVLNIHWKQPISNAASVNDYVVEVQEYIHQSGSRTLLPRPLDPPFRQEVQVESNGAMTATVTTDISELFN